MRTCAHVNQADGMLAFSWWFGKMINKDNRPKQSPLHWDANDNFLVQVRSLGFAKRISNRGYNCELNWLPGIWAQEVLPLQPDRIAFGVPHVFELDNSC